MISRGFLRFVFLSCISRIDIPMMILHLRTNLKSLINFFVDSKCSFCWYNHSSSWGYSILDSAHLINLFVSVLQINSLGIWCSNGFWSSPGIRSVGDVAHYLLCFVWWSSLRSTKLKIVSSQLLRNMHCLFWNDIHLDIVLSRVLVQAIPSSHILYAFLGSIACNYEFLDVLLNHMVHQGEWYFCNPVLLLLMTITLDQIILISILLIRDFSHSPISDLTAMNVNGKVLKSRHFGSDTAANIVFKALFVECSWVSCTSLFHFHILMIFI